MASSPRHLAIDISRLVTRFSRPAPNGIDRVDLAYVRHVLSREGGGSGVVASPVGPRLVRTSAGSAIVQAITEHWRESAAVEQDAGYDALRRWLETPPSVGAPRLDLANGSLGIATTSAVRTIGRVGRLLASGALTGPQGMWPGRSLAQALPEGSVYLNVSTFPVWIDSYFAWLDRRRDVKAAFFVHDLLPLSHPEFFPPSEARRHAARLAVVGRRASGIIVASEATRDSLKRHFVKIGVPERPILVAPLPPSLPATSTSGPRLEPVVPYFVCVGTLEPRKNHLLLLQIWRDLVDELGASAPRLVLVGATGWDCENVFDMLERCDRIGGHVVRAGRLSSPAVRHLASAAAAVLMPSFAEGYGLPVVEALAAGAIVVASGVPALEAAPQERLVQLDPLDGVGWKRRVLMLARMACEAKTGITPHRARSAGSWELHMRNAEQFLHQL